MLSLWIAMNGLTAIVPMPAQLLNPWEGTHRLTNGRVELEVVPSIGRIMRFAFVGGRNVLWVNPDLRGKVRPVGNPDFLNFGGDKIWNAPQSDWGWPPDADLDGAPHALQTEGKVLILTSPISAKTGLQSVRRIELDPSRERAIIRSRLINRGLRPVRCAVWQVMQIPPPDRVEVPLTLTTEFPQGWKPYPNVKMPAGAWGEEPGLLWLKRDPNTAYKVGLPDRPYEIRARFGTVRLTMSALPDPSGPYPDDGKARQIYSNPGKLDYMELEANTALRTLAPGESAELVVTWELSVARPR